VISGKNIIVTAAHCVYDTVNNRFYTNWSFVPAYRAGAAPYGTFGWTQARVLTAWVNAPNENAAWQYDVALIALRPNSAGQPVTYYTGYLGRSWNYGYVQHINSFGYPSNLDSSKWQVWEQSESWQAGTEIMGIGNNMQFGASGGPWIRVFKPYWSGAMNYVNNVNSFISKPCSTCSYYQAIYAARFNSNNIVPLCTAQGC
jgi:V8-like Glu-specific endopeptidase